MALNYILQNNFKPNVGMRPDSRKIGVLITDGKSQDEIVVNSQRLRDSGIELYAIGKLISSWHCWHSVSSVSMENESLHANKRHSTQSSPVSKYLTTFHLASLQLNLRLVDPAELIEIFQ